MRLLLVDDDAAIRLVAGRALRRGGFTVTEAIDAVQAFDALRADTPDVILLDWMMPGIDGLEVCRRLKADPLTAAIPIVFLTARSQHAEVQRGLSLGAIGFIVKPFDALTLPDDVRRCLAASA